MQVSVCVCVILHVNPRASKPLPVCAHMRADRTQIHPSARPSIRPLSVHPSIHPQTNVHTYIHAYLHTYIQIHIIDHIDSLVHAFCLSFTHTHSFIYSPIHPCMQFNNDSCAAFISCISFCLFFYFNHLIHFIHYISIHPVRSVTQSVIHAYYIHACMQTHMYACIVKLTHK